MEKALEALAYLGQDESTEAGKNMAEATNLVTEAVVSLREILVSFDDAMAQESAKNQKPLSCTRCGKPVSSPVPEATVVRGFIECPECIEKHGNETLVLDRADMAKLRGVYADNEQRGKDFVEKTTKEMRETTEKEREDKRIVREMYLYQQGKAAGMKEAIDEMFFKVDGHFPKHEAEALLEK